jgi:hypothetical protein|tara:strand:+ start:1828 stop:2766 length:939 start_codon:yes stop_codon:yes gene_type:complete
MSRVAKNSSAPAIKSPVSIVEEVVSEEVKAVAAPSMCKFTRRVVCQCEFTAAEIAKGVVNPFTTSAAKIFTPQGESEGFDFTKGIVTEIAVNSISSDYDAPVHVSMNLFNGRLVDKEGAYSDPVKITNASGWLYTPSSDDFGATAASGSRGFTNLITMLPREQTRAHQVLYKPTNVMNNRFIEQYGGYSANSLHNGIIPFEGEDYVYVPHDHVVMNVIRNNWESLGINADLETKRENRYLKINSGIVDDVINQLKSQVLSQMPFTNFKELKLNYKSAAVSHADPTEKFQLCAEFCINYMFPTVTSRGDTSAA